MADDTGTNTKLCCTRMLRYVPLSLTAVYAPVPYRTHVLKSLYSMGTGIPSMTPVRVWPYTVYSTVLTPQIDVSHRQTCPNLFRLTA